MNFSAWIDAQSHSRYDLAKIPHHSAHGKKRGIVQRMDEDAKSIVRDFFNRPFRYKVVNIEEKEGVDLITAKTAIRASGRFDEGKCFERIEKYPLSYLLKVLLNAETACKKVQNEKNNSHIQIVLDRLSSLISIIDQQIRRLRLVNSGQKEKTLLISDLEQNTILEIALLFNDLFRPKDASARIPSSHVAGTLIYAINKSAVANK